MTNIPDSSDRMPSPPDSIALIKIKQAHKLLSDAMKSPSFFDMDLDERVAAADAHALLERKFK